MTDHGNQPFLPETNESNNSHHEFTIEDPEEKDESKCKGINHLLYTFLGVFLASADETLVTATYGTISSVFHRLELGAWLLTGYDFGYCVGLPIYGTLSDVYGRKRPLVLAYLLFGLGCLVCGLSTSLAQLIVGRVIAGLGGAGTAALASVIIADIMPPSEVAVLRGWMNTVNIIGRSLGAPIGSFLTETVGWRWAFMGQIPLIAFCVYVAVYRLPTSHPEKNTKLRQVDIAGIVVFAATVASFLGMVYLSGQSQSGFYLAIGGFIISLAIFLLIEAFWAERPLIPLSLMPGAFGGFCLVQVLLYSGRFALVTQIVPFFIRVENMDDVLASSFLVATAVGIAIGAMASGYIIKRTKRYKKMVITSLLGGMMSYFLILLRWRHGCSILEGLYVFPAGLAKGMIFSAQFICMSASVPKEHLATCVTVYYLSSQLGVVIGTSTGSAMVQGVFRRLLGERLPLLSGREGMINGVLNEARYVAGLVGWARRIVRGCYLASFQFLPVFSLLCTGLALPLVIFPQERKID